MTDNIELKPTWVGLAPALITLLEHGSDKAKAAARDEIMRMARAADQKGSKT